MKIYEVYHFRERSADLFKPYIAEWFKMKTEVSEKKS